MDLVFLLDSSESFTAENFGNLKNFIKNFLRESDIKGGSVSTFDGVAFNLNTYSSKTDILDAVDALPVPDQGTPVADASLDDGTHIYAIGIGLTNTQKLEGIANTLSEQNVFTLENIGGLDGFQVFGAVCGES